MTSFNAPIPHIFAHRGGNAAGQQTENSQAAFASAVELGFKFLETDVLLTKDKEVITYHGSLNIIMKQLSGLEKRSKVQELTYDQVQRRIANRGQPIPRVIDLLKKFKDQCFSIDLKTDEVVEPLLRIIKQENAQDRVIITSFNKERSLRANRLLFGKDFSEASLCVYRTKGYLIRFFSKYMLTKLKKSGFKYLQIPYVCVNQKLIDQAEKLGIYIYAWTPDEEADIERILRLKAHGIISNEANRVMQISKKSSSYN